MSSLADMATQYSADHPGTLTIECLQQVTLEVRGVHRSDAEYVIDELALDHNVKVDDLDGTMYGAQASKVIATRWRPDK